MIVDCDTHFFPKDAFDYLEGALADRRPRLVFDGDVLCNIEFAEGPSSAGGATPLPAPGSGAHYAGMADGQSRMAAYAELGIEKQPLAESLLSDEFLLDNRDRRTGVDRRH